jgi:hypothetical protein
MHKSCMHDHDTLSYYARSVNVIIEPAVIHKSRFNENYRLKYIYIYILELFPVINNYVYRQENDRSEDKYLRTHQLW